MATRFGRNLRGRGQHGTQGSIVLHPDWRQLQASFVLSQLSKALRKIPVSLSKWEGQSGYLANHPQEGEV